MKKILLTGCEGQLGRAIRKEYGSTASFILTDMVDAEGVLRLDIADLSAVLSVMESQRPDVIINCAAYTNVDGCEVNTETACRANAIGPRNLAIAAEKFGAKLIHVSTDYVFPGNADAPITEFATPQPVSAYGRTKLAGEQFVQQFASRWFILRTAWLYGDGHNFVKTMLRLAETHDEVSVVCDQQGTPTSAAELARMIHYLEPTDEYGVYHATCEGSTNWASFAEEIFAQAGVACHVKHVTSEEYAAMNPASANRPHYSILDNQMLRLTGADFVMADWKDALREYMGKTNE